MNRNDAYRIIESPVVTEKSTYASERNQVIFNVAKGATKPEIKAAVETLFSVKVKTVNTLNRRGKAKMFRRFPGKRADIRRAIVTLEEGHSIDVATGL